MKILPLHSWELSAREAVQVQKEFAQSISIAPRTNHWSLVAAADVSYSKRDPRIFSAVVVMKLPELEVVEAVTAAGLARFPYVPGLLSFREIPILAQAFQELSTVPDVLLCDGQGIAHPRRFGLASHLGLLYDLPAVGCAKSRLIGEYAELEKAQWTQTPLIDRGERIGTVVRARKGVKPLFISPGHLMDCESSVELVRQCTGRFRLPEPIRQAHILVNQTRING